MSVRKLNDDAVSKVVGGKSLGLIVGGSVVLFGLAASTGTFIAGEIYAHMADKATANGDNTKAHHYNQNATHLKAVSSSLGGAAPVVGIISGFATSAIAIGVSDADRASD